MVAWKEEFLNKKIINFFNIPMAMVNLAIALVSAVAFYKKHPLLVIIVIFIVLGLQIVYLNYKVSSLEHRYSINESKITDKDQKITQLIETNKTLRSAKNNAELDVTNLQDLLTFISYSNAEIEGIVDKLTDSQGKIKLYQQIKKQ